MTLRFPTLYHTLVLPLAVLMILVALAFLSFTAQIETEELRHRLNHLTVRTDAADASDLLLRLEQELRSNSARFTRRELPEAELRLLAAFPERKKEDTGWLQAEGLPLRSLRQAIALLQRAAGVTPLEYLYIEGEIDLITLAYNLERRRYFSEALVTFQKALKPGVSGATRDFILLHSGYNFFFLGAYDAAANAWQDVSRSGATAANRQLATRLVAWLHRFSGRRGRVAQIANPKNRALEFYRIMAYKDSLETLLQVAESQRDQNYFYLRGRVYEGPGDYDAAVKDYRAVIARGQRSDLAALANRRLFLMGAFYRHEAELAATAQKAAPTLGDSRFFALAVPYAENPPRLPAPDKAYRDLLKTTAKQLGEKKKAVVVRVKTHDGSVITGRQVTATAAMIVLENENGRFRIPAADIESKEIVSGN